MNPNQINLVTAFGRGEDLARRLGEAGFSLRVLDFTEAFDATYRRGPGPFPIAREHFAGAFPESQLLPRGLTFWLDDGPLELGGPMAEFFAARTAVKVLRGAAPAAEYRQDWLRRFVKQMASPHYAEAWDIEDSFENFPWNQELFEISAYREESSLNFRAFRAQPSVDRQFVSAQRLEDVRLVNGRLSEIVVEAGQAMAFQADQWIWCLSSAETESLNAPLAQTLFPRGVARAEWSWISFQLSVAHGPWIEGLPAHIAMIGDMYLPFVYANLALLRRWKGDTFRAWMRVPATAVHQSDRRRDWVEELERRLNQRLPLAKWVVDPDDWGLCPHSPVFGLAERDRSVFKWKNWDWIAPETLSRLDFGARLERESLALKRIVQWRADQLKKQGASSDQTLHAP